MLHTINNGTEFIKMRLEDLGHGWVLAHLRSTHPEPLLVTLTAIGIESLADPIVVRSHTTALVFLRTPSISKCHLLCSWQDSRGDLYGITEVFVAAPYEPLTMPQALRMVPYMTQITRNLDGKLMLSKFIENHGIYYRFSPFRLILCSSSSVQYCGWTTARQLNQEIDALFSRKTPVPWIKIFTLGNLCAKLEDLIWAEGESSLALPLIEKICTITAELGIALPQAPAQIKHTSLVVLETRILTWLGAVRSMVFSKPLLE